MIIESINIGNLFIGRKDEICSVINVHSEDIPFVDIQNKDGVVYREAFESLRPIELNEEWLNMFNFSVNKKDCRVYDDNNVFGEFNTGLYFHFATKYKMFYLMQTVIYTSVSIEYVHQFQNWYYLLTGNKLKIK